MSVLKRAARMPVRHTRSQRIASSYDIEQKYWPTPRLTPAASALQVFSRSCQGSNWIASSGSPQVRREQHDQHRFCDLHEQLRLTIGSVSRLA